MESQRRNRVVIPTSSKQYRRGARYPQQRPREGIVAISVIAAATLATFAALFLTSRPFDPMNSTFDAQRGVPQGPLAMQSPKASPTPTPEFQNTATPETSEPAGEAASPPPDDAGIQAQIEKSLSSDAALDQLDVSTIVEGGKVTIVGSVRSAELRQRVERVVRSVKGVTAIDNQLVILEATPSQTEVCATSS
jgi:hypothetical protein